MSSIMQVVVDVMLTIVRRRERATGVEAILPTVGADERLFRAARLDVIDRDM
ncbi:MAG: hypothetical protein ACYTGL_23235 [Planctomycetota bacterium]|jgi:hypothetical protein